MMIIVSRGIRDAISFSVYFLQTVIRRISITRIEKVILIENRNIVPVDETEDSIILYNLYTYIYMKKKIENFSIKIQATSSRPRNDGISSFTPVGAQ